MAIRIYDSMAKQQVDLTPRVEGRISMYCCGPTVYNYIHIGNARTFVWFEQIRRYLTYRGYDVTYVMNYTDVDDRIIERAALEGVPTHGVTAKYAGAFEEDMAALGVATADILCRATDHITGMIEAIEKLIAGGAAYEVDGDVFFAVEKDPTYGKLSGRSLDEMRAGERVEPHPSKRHALDFALWKKAAEDEVSWPSPWGPGRPGWHIECSVMSMRYLGDEFDLHGGGSDLIFPHHENEIAQAEGVAGEGSFAKHWMHSGMVQMETEKMSKSLGNVFLARDAVQRWPGEVVRYWALMGSYRTQSTFSQMVLDDAGQSYGRWAQFLHSARHLLGDDMPSPSAARRSIDDEVAGSVGRFIEAMDDDFNSAGAFSVIHEVVGNGNRLLETAPTDAAVRDELIGVVAEFLEMTAALGFSFPEQESSGLAGETITFLLELRDRAREEKRFDLADEIRDRLTQMGVVIEDTPTGARWRAGA